MTEVTTGEYAATMTMIPEFAALREHVDHAMERLRYEIGIKIEEVLEAHKDKDVVLCMSAIDTPIQIPNGPYAPDRIEYKMRFTSALLHWQDAEIGDCVHANSIIPYRRDQVETVMQDNNKRASFIWEGRWWRRTA